MFQCRNQCKQGVESARKSVLDRMLQKEADLLMTMNSDDAAEKTSILLKQDNTNVKPSVQPKEKETEAASSPAPKVEQINSSQDKGNSNTNTIVKKDDIEGDSLDIEAQNIEQGKEMTKELKPEQKDMLNKMNDAQVKFNAHIKESQNTNYIKPVNTTNNTDGFIGRMVKTFGGKNNV